MSDLMFKRDNNTHLPIRVLLVVENPLFGMGLQQLLEDEEISVFSIPGGDVEALWESIESQAPDVIVFDFVVGFIRPHGLFETLDRLPKTRLILIDWLANQVQIYEKQSHDISTVSDFLTVMR